MLLLLLLLLPRDILLDFSCTFIVHRQGIHVHVIEPLAATINKSRMLLLEPPISADTAELMLSRGMLLNKQIEVSAFLPCLCAPRDDGQYDLVFRLPQGSTIQEVSEPYW